MADLGARAYRFSISWSRVLPTGSGAINQAGLDFYERLVDALLAAGVQPLINLFHWDLPQPLQDRGGFANPEVVGWFTDYAALLASTLSDRVKDWMTFNEPAVFAFLGHADGIHAPGLRDWPTAIRVADNELRAHAAATQAIRAQVDGAKIGVAIDVNQVAPATDSDPRFSVRISIDGSGAVVEKVFRILREGVTNVRRHADAHVANIAAHSDGPRVTITIDDDGCGFGAEAPPPWSIVSRVTELGGSLEIVDDETPGAHLAISLPAA
jgi:hypothetical protein